MDKYVVPKIYGYDKIKLAIYFQSLMQNEEEDKQLSICLIGEEATGKTTFARWVSKNSEKVSVIDDFDLEFIEWDTFGNMFFTSRPRYDSEDKKNTLEGLAISKNVLQNMDLIFVLKDIRNENLDRLKMEYMFGSQPIKMENKAKLLQSLNPKFAKETKEYLQNFFLKKRTIENKDHSYTFKTLNTLIKLSIAAAKHRGSNNVSQDDCQLAIEIVEESKKEYSDYFKASEIKVESKDISATPSKRDDDGGAKADVKNN